MTTIFKARNSSLYKAVRSQVDDTYIGEAFRFGFLKGVLAYKRGADSYRCYGYFDKYEKRGGAAGFNYMEVQGYDN